VGVAVTRESRAAMGIVTIEKCMLSNKVDETVVRVGSVEDGLITQEFVLNIDFLSSICTRLSTTFVFSYTARDDVRLDNINSQAVKGLRRRTVSTKLSCEITGV
jgi:hypothetical protein